MIRSHLSTYTDEEKMEILDEYLSSGLPMDVIQKKYHMSHCTISKWLSKFDLSNFRETQFNTMQRIAQAAHVLVNLEKNLSLKKK